MVWWMFLYSCWSMWTSITVEMRREGTSHWNESNLENLLSFIVMSLVVEQKDKRTCRWCRWVHFWFIQITSKRMEFSLMNIFQKLFEFVFSSLHICQLTWHEERFLSFSADLMTYLTTAHDAQLACFDVLYINEWLNLHLIQIKFSSFSNASLINPSNEIFYCSQM